MTGDEDATHTSATVLDPPDPALAPTVRDGSSDGSAPAGQIVIRTTLEGLPQPGERVGRYELGQVIGRGGMGVVFRARDPSLPT